jgi:hypothetical protein
MKASISKLVETPQTSVFQTVIQTPGVNSKEATPSRKSQNRYNYLSESRDTHDNRGPRRIKTTHNSQTLFRSCGDFNL